MVDNIRENNIFTTIPPSYPPRRGEEESEAWGGSCYLQIHPNEKHLFSHFLWNTFSHGM